MDAPGRLLSTRDARTARGDTYASFVLSNLSRASITARTHANHEPVLNSYDAFRILSCCIRREYNSTKVLADSNWHHILLRWNVATGQWSLFVDGEAGHIGQATARTGLSFLSHLTVGQSRSASGAVMDSGFKGDILHFNMWQREFLSQDALDLYENCSIQLGTLVPWTELLQRLHGDVKKFEFVRCQPDGKKFLLNTILCV